MEKDKLLWKGHKNGLFIVKATDVHLAGGNTKTIPMKMLWNSYAPPKTSFFCLESLVRKSANNRET